MMKEMKTSFRLDLKLRCLFWMSVAAAAILFVYPSVSDSCAAIRQAELMLNYDLLVSGLSGPETETMMKSAASYNQNIAEQQMKRRFEYMGDDITDEEYEKELCLNSKGTMGYLEIPGINLRLPIAHGTKNEVLQYEIGHVYGSSLPIGGKSTHSVLAGHTGLSTAELFSRLTEVREGESFYIHTADEVHEYEVISIRTVWPGDEFAYLQVEPGLDLITLYTCTPYGVNDHRLLVTGQRKLPDPVLSSEQSILDAADRRKRAIIKIALLSLIPVIVLVIGIFRVCAKKRMKKRRR